MKNARTMAQALLVLWALIVGAGEALAAEGKYPAAIRIGYQPGHFLVLVTKSQGWLEQEFAKDGVAIQFEKFLAGPPIIEAFAGDRLDFGQVGDQPTIQARANNIDLKAIGVYYSSSRCDGLVVPPGSDIRKLEDLKGKKVAVTVGTTGHQLLNLYLKSVGLTQKDIQVVNLLPPDIKTALAAGNVDAAITWEPFISTNENEKTGINILDATGFKKYFNLILVRDQFARDYPDVVRRVLRTYARAEQWIHDNPEKTVELAAKETGFKPEVLAKVIPKMSFDIRLTGEAIASITDTAHFLRETNTIRKDVDVRDIVDTSYFQDPGRNVQTAGKAK